MGIFISLTDRETNEETTFRDWKSANDFLGRNDGYIQAFISVKNQDAVNSEGKRYKVDILTYII